MTLETRLTIVGKASNRCSLGNCAKEFSSTLPVCLSPKAGKLMTVRLKSQKKNGFPTFFAAKSEQEYELRYRRRVSGACMLSGRTR